MNQYPAKQNQKKLKQLLCEQLEPRCLMAGDMQVAFHLEAVNSAGDRVTQVQIGESFVVRASVERLPAARPELMLNNTFDLTYNSDLVKSKNPIAVEGRVKDSPWRLLGNGKATTLPKLVAVSVQSTEPWDATDVNEPKSEASHWEFPMTAVAGGEVVFGTNPGSLYHGQFRDHNDPFILELENQLLDGKYFPTEVDADSVQHAWLRLQIGDPGQFPPSPWRNPKDPNDVNDDGKVNKSDANLLKDKLAALGAIDLVHASFGAKSAPYLDVNGDRILDSKDIELVEDQFVYVPPATNWGDWPDKPNFLVDQKSTASMVVKNIRTGKIGGEDALVGDLLSISIVADRNDPKSSLGNIKRLYPEFKTADGFEPVRMDGEKYVVRLTSPGTVKFELAIMDEKEIPGISAWWGDAPDEVQRALQSFANSTSVSVQVGENLNRPVAVDLTVPIFDSAISARDLVVPNEPLYDKKVIAQIDVLSNTSPGTRAMVIDGMAFVDEKGLLNYYIYNFNYLDANLRAHSYRDTYLKAKSGGSFTYVLMNDQGTSEVHTVTIPPKVLPLLDLSIRAVDEQGNEVTEAKVGQTLDVEVTTYSNRLSKNVDGPTPLSFTYKFNSNVASKVGEPDSLATVVQEIVTGLIFENGKYKPISTIVNHTPKFTQQEEGVLVEFDRYNLADNINSEKVLFKQKVVVTKAGPLNLSLDNIKLVEYPADEPILFDSRSVNVVESKPEIITASLKAAARDGAAVGESESGEIPNRMSVANASSTLSLDVDRNGQVTSLDVLRIINYINKSNEVSSMQPSFTAQMDVDKDGFVTAVDVLKVINFVNAQSESNSTESKASGEGESSPPTPPTFATMPTPLNGADFDEHESFEQKNRRRR